MAPRNSADHTRSGIDDLSALKDLDHDLGVICRRSADDLHMICPTCGVLAAYLTRTRQIWGTKRKTRVLVK